MKKNLFLVLLLVLILLLPSGIRAAAEVVSDEAVNVNNALDALIGKEPAGEKYNENSVPVNDQGKVKKVVKKAKKAKTLVNETERDGRFIAYDNGTVLDTQTNLMWAAKDNGSDINWADAKDYCENYRGGGYTDWRMPTQDDLAGLYDKSKPRSVTSCPANLRGAIIHVVTELIDITCIGSWASGTSGSKAVRFNFVDGKSQWVPPSYSNFRALPVRYSKTEKPVAMNEQQNLSGPDQAEEAPVKKVKKAKRYCNVILFSNDINLAGPYQGGCKDGLAEGEGAFSYTSNVDQNQEITTVKGEFHEGKLNGHVIQDRPGMHFEGEFLENRAIHSNVNGRQLM
jgi:hypothetical protein